MARYIDAELVPIMADLFTDEQDKTHKKYFIEALSLIPTADVQEIKHGHWSKEMYECVDAFGDRHIGYLCSNCKQVANKMNYCGNCGAIMDEETK